MNADIQSIQVPPNHVYSSYKDAFDALIWYGLKNSYGFHQKDSCLYSLDSKTWFYYRYNKASKYESQVTT